MNVVALDADMQQVPLGMPRRRGDLGENMEGPLFICRSRVVVRKVVDQFLGAHRITHGHPPGFQKAAHIRIRTRIDIDAEGRDRMFSHPFDRVVVKMSIVFAIERFAW